MGKKGLTILIITVIYLCAAISCLLPLFGGGRISDARVNSCKVNIEYMSIHMRGGITGHIDESIEVFSEGNDYYLVSTDDGSIKHELTKFEYLLCTEIDFDMLRDQEGILGSDLIYEHVEYRHVTGDIVSLPAKSYYNFPGMIYFFNRILTTPDYEITRADELAIELAKYSYLNNSPDIMYRSSECLGDSIYGTYTSLYYGNGNPQQQYEFWQKCKDITNDAGKIVNTYVNRGYDGENKDEMLKEYKSIPSHPGSVYYRVQTNDAIVLVSIADLENSTFCLAYADKSRQQDIVRIMTGNETGLAGTVITIAIETLVFAGAVGAVMVISKKKKANSPAVKSSSVKE